MNEEGKDYILKQICSLKAAKIQSISGAVNKDELAIAVRHNNLIDLLLLPLYYAWEKITHGDIKKLCIEGYLKKSYRKYKKNAEILTQEITMLLITYKQPLCDHEVDEDTILSISEIYNELILCFRCNENHY